MCSFPDCARHPYGNLPLCKGHYQQRRRGQALLPLPYVDLEKSEKRCPSCLVVKGLAEFSRNKARQNGYESSCKFCTRARAKAFREAHREHLSTYRKRWNVANPERSWRYGLRKYGLTATQYEVLLEAQGGRCALGCGRLANCVDHCHETGVVRGLLCRSCNSAIGVIAESENQRKRLSEYLDHSEKTAKEVWGRKAR